LAPRCSLLNTTREILIARGACSGLGFGLGDPHVSRRDWALLPVPFSLLPILLIVGYALSRTPVSRPAKKAARRP
jgi:hypothetical protein